MSEDKLDWHNGEKEPEGFNNREGKSGKEWPESWRTYVRNESVQKDLRYVAETVEHLFRVQLDNFIRSNDKLWVDFCKMKTDVWGNPTNLLDVTGAGYDSNAQRCYATKDSVIPVPEEHFRFSPRLVEMAISLYQKKINYNFSQFGQLAMKRLRSFVSFERT